ncbi:hypothetical protein LAZ67_8001087 [Cordylochernes scorpioides]|uniref:Helix-turn-helix domain-containing protein n=1 Tax=Cordylochernes scorpioides TaxID=51811 RepID=A0ABY6KPX4_9ARAC|nr:hypothetical protein LAZ67_8001087 [Cordylochernes scorpioides]
MWLIIISYHHEQTLPYHTSTLLTSAADLSLWVSFSRPLRSCSSRWLSASSWVDSRSRSWSRFTESRRDSTVRESFWFSESTDCSSRWTSSLFRWVTSQLRWNFWFSVFFHHLLQFGILELDLTQPLVGDVQVQQRVVQYHPNAACITISQLEIKALNSLENYVYYFKRYVDDSILFINQRSEQKCMDTFNNLLPDINYSMEVDNNKSINFLDMNLSYNNNNITTSIYKKPTHTGTYWNFSSQHHFSQKVGLVKALIYRAFTLINDTTKRNIEIYNIKKELFNEDFSHQIDK